MKAVTKKKVEIAIWLINLVAFIVVNLFFLRTFHYVSTVVMAVPLVITLLFNVIYNYVDWGKKSPSVLPLFITFLLYIVSSVVIRIPDTDETVGTVFAVIYFLSGVLSFIFFIIFMISYNKAFGMHRKELELDKKQRLYNLSIPVFFAFFMLIVWAFTISFADKLATEESSGDYESVIADSEYAFFPASLPDDAENEEFKYMPGLWLASSRAYVRFETTEDYLTEYESKYSEDVTEITSVDAWTDRHIESGVICTYINENYIDKDDCEVYIMTEGHSIQGYAIDRDTNELFIFYDGFD